mgnify:CR=1 FL=1
MRYNKCKLYFLIVISLFMFPLQSYSGEIDDDYIIEGAGTGIEGSYLVKVTLISKKLSASDDLFSKHAVHGVLFRGFESQQHRQHQRAMVESNQQEEHAAFYEDFFKGDMRPYAEVVEGSRQVRLSGKKYRISSVVQVYKDKLRQYLEGKGIINKLTNGF